MMQMLYVLYIATTELATPAEKEASTSSSRHENSQENTAECDGEQLSLSSEG